MERSVPMDANQSAPFSMIDGTDAMVSTLLTTVGRAYKPGDGGERGLEAGLAASSLEGVQQRCLLAADVGTRAGVDGHVKVVPGAVDVLAKMAGLVGLGHGLEQAAVDVHNLAAQVDESVVGADRE